MNIASSPPKFFQRSVNIERDFDNLSLVETFIPSPTAENVLLDMAGALKVGKRPLPGQAHTARESHCLPLS